jgi:flagellar motor component MotA
VREENKMTVNKKRSNTAVIAGLIATFLIIVGGYMVIFSNTDFFTKLLWLLAVGAGIIILLEVDNSRKKNIAKPAAAT